MPTLLNNEGAFNTKAPNTGNKNSLQASKVAVELLLIPQVEQEKNLGAAPSRNALNNHSSVEI